MPIIQVGNDILDYEVSITTLQGCCGVGVAYGLRVGYYMPKNEKKFVKPLAEDILKSAKSCGYSSLIITSIPPGGVKDYSLAFYTAGAEHREDGINLYKIAKSMRMRTVSKVKNYKTNNTIVTFVKDI